jgi:hypothetical protein
MLEAEGYEDAEVVRAMNGHNQRKKDLMLKTIRRL